MKIVTPQQMREIDSIVINEVGIPGIVLMENAAIRIVDEISKTIGSLSTKNIIIFAGKGNNGGDALAVARHLFNKGAKISIFLLAEKKEIKGDEKINLEILENMGIEVVELTKKKQLSGVTAELPGAELVVDGIFGTGLKNEIKGLIKDVIKTINSSGRFVLSIDIPSGISGLTGQMQGICIKAKKTVTLCLPKPGLVIHPGCEYAGELVVGDISIPAKVIEDLDIKMHVIERKKVLRIFPGRHADSNKGDYGRVLIISGSVGMTGAGCLAANAALRIGAGLVYLGVPSILTSVYDAAFMEAVTIPLEDKGAGILSSACLKQILERLNKMSVIAIGPGLSVNQDIVEIITEIVDNSKIPVILDADALNALAMDKDILRKLKAPAIITPHPGEMSRLAGISVEDVQNNRIDVSREFACTWGVITVLKGARTIVALPDGTIYVNPTGNSGMATAGTGDVLTGIIAGLIGQGATPEDAAIAGVYLHGLAGDHVARINGEHGLIASDLINELPHIMKGMLKSGSS